jgi:hypothetical protein
MGHTFQFLFEMGGRGGFFFSSFIAFINFSVPL